MSATTNAAKIFSHAKFGDVNYENKEDCDWIIEAPPGILFLFFKHVTQNGHSTPVTAYVDQCLGALHSKYWSKYAFSHFWQKKLTKGRKA